MRFVLCREFDCCPREPYPQVDSGVFSRMEAILPDCFFHHFGDRQAWIKEVTEQVRHVVGLSSVRHVTEPGFIYVHGFIAIRKHDSFRDIGLYTISVESCSISGRDRPSTPEAPIGPCASTIIPPLAHDDDGFRVGMLNMCFVQEARSVHAEEFKNPFGGIRQHPFEGESKRRRRRLCCIWVRCMRSESLTLLDLLASHEEGMWLLVTDSRVMMRLGTVIQSCCLLLSVEELWETKYQHGRL